MFSSAALIIAASTMLSRASPLSVVSRASFTTAFVDQTSATVSDSYMGYALADTAAGCKDICLARTGCISVNGYLDNYGKGETVDGKATQFTCSLFGTAITDASMNTNTGGQIQTPGGTVTNKITQSAGWVLASPPTCGNAGLAWTFDRAYSPSNDDHYYTIFLQQTAEQGSDYKVEGAIGKVFVNRVPATVPLYHLYSASATDNFYTTSTSERDNAIAQYAYADRGITGFVYTDAVCGGVPLYRRYNGNDHFYTVSEVEAIGSGYSDEGIAAYIVPNPSS